MTNKIYKNGSLPFAIDAYDQSVYDSKIIFSTQDVGTARLVFKLRKDGMPLPLSAVEGKLVLLFSNGSKHIRNISLLDKVEGIAEYILKNEEIKLYGNVQASLNLFYSNGQSLSVHEFTFSIKKNLIDENIVPAAEYYIDHFDSLKSKIEQKAVELESDIQKRIDEITKELQEQLDRMKEKLDDLEALETKQGAQDKVDKSLAAAKKYTDDHANNSEIHVVKADKDKWNNGQLYKLTADNGKVARLANGTDIFTLPTGFYMGANLLNVPVEDGSFYYIEVLETAYSQSGINYKRIIVTRSFDNLTWIGTFHAQGFRGWKKTLTVEDVANSTYVDTYDQDNSSVSAAENVATKLVFGATRADDLSEYNRTRAEITLKNSGLYLIRLYITSTNITVGSDNILACYVNGSEYQRFGNWNPTTASSTCVLYLTQKFKAGDKVTFYITPRGTNKTVSINTSYVTMSQLR